MALSYVTYAGDGSTTNFTYDKGYLQTSDVSVYLDGVLQTITTDYSWFSSTVIQFVTPPGAGVVVKIARSTQNTSRVVDFQDAANLTESDLDTSADQMFYLAQEGLDNFTDNALTLDTDDKWDAASKVIKNVTDPTNAQDAATKAYGDANWGAAAAAAAEAAQAAAETAQTAAETAQSNAESAETGALNAQTATAAIYDQFDDRYLGSKASDPTLDNDGNSLQIGALYWNSVTAAMRVYSGSVWNDVQGITESYADTLYAPIEALGRNMLLNSDFEIWQRGTSKTGVTSSTYLADRWKLVPSGTSAVYHMVKATTAATAGANANMDYLKLDATTGDSSIAAADVVQLTYTMEGYDARALMIGTSAAKTVTLSFMHSHEVTGTYCVAFRNGANNRTYIAEYTQSVSDAWEQAEITITLDTSTSATWALDETAGLKINWVIAAGTNWQNTKDTWHSTDDVATSSQVNGTYNGATGAACRFARMKLEIGDAATPFCTAYPTLGQELAACQRYYEKSYSPGEDPGSSSGKEGSFAVGLYKSIVNNEWVFNTWTFKVSKRVPPVMTLYNNLATSSGGEVNVNGTARAVTTHDINENGWMSIRNVSGVTWTDGWTASFHWQAEAEL